MGETSSIQKLIEFSKKIREATTQKEKYVTILQQLTFYSNFIRLVDGREREIQTLFNRSYELVQSSLGFETMCVYFENCTTEFTFDPVYWILSIQDTNTPRTSTVWHFQKSFKPGDKETFSTVIHPTTSFSNSLTYNLSLIFSIEFNNTHFQRVFPCGKLEIDVLYFLNPVRSFSSNITSKTDTFVSNSESNLNERKLQGGVVKFELKVNDTLEKSFLLDIFLRDVKRRGFEGIEKSPCTLMCWVGSEEVGVELGKGKVVVRTGNFELLLGLKKAIFQRILCLPNLKLNPPTDIECEEIYRLKLWLESEGTESFSFVQFHEIYMQLRKATEGIEFTLPENVVPEKNEKDNQQDTYTTFTID